MKRMSAEVASFHIDLRPPNRPRQTLQHPTEMVTFEILVLFSFCALSLALPTSLLEDMKDAQLQSPIRTNKVKRAQEFIMFGNQQNRVANNFGNVKTEKRAAELDENSLVEDEVPLPTLMSDLEEQVYNNNQLGSGKEDDRSQLSRDLYYTMLLRNLDLTQNLHNDPAYNLDSPYYNIMDSRAKREAKSSKISRSSRLKREYTLSPDELISLMKLMELEKMIANAEPREQYNMRPTYEEVEDYEGIDDDSPYGNNVGSWYDGPVFNTHPELPRQHKRFMVSKRSSGMAPFHVKYSDDIPLNHRVYH